MLARPRRGTRAPSSDPPRTHRSHIVHKHRHSSSLSNALKRNVDVGLSYLALALQFLLCLLFLFPPNSHSPPQRTPTLPNPTCTWFSGNSQTKAGFLTLSASYMFVNYLEVLQGNHSLASSECKEARWWVSIIARCVRERESEDGRRRAPNN